MIKFHSCDADKLHIQINNTLTRIILGSILVVCCLYILSLTNLKEQIVCDKNHDNQVNNCRLERVNYLFRTTVNVLGNLQAAYFNKDGVFLKTDHGTVCFTTDPKTLRNNSQFKECFTVKNNGNQFMNPEFFYRKISSSINAFIDNRLEAVFPIPQHNVMNFIVLLIVILIIAGSILFYRDISIKFDKKSQSLIIKTSGNLLFKDEICNLLLSDNVVVSKDSFFRHRQRAYTIQFIKQEKTTTMRFYTHSLVSAKFIEMEINSFLSH